MNDTPENEDKKIVPKTFDMYSCFSRIDVLLAILFILLALWALMWFFLTGNQVV